jgi:hypothetical protein
MQPIRIGVLALQGSFREHMTLLRRIPGVEPVEVRTKEELDSVAGIIIPGAHRPWFCGRAAAAACGVLPAASPPPAGPACVPACLYTIAAHSSNPTCPIHRLNPACLPACLPACRGREHHDGAGG